MIDYVFCFFLSHFVSECLKNKAQVEPSRASMQGP